MAKNANIAVANFATQLVARASQTRAEVSTNKEAVRAHDAKDEGNAANQAP